MKANEAPKRIWIDLATDLPKLSGHIDKDSIEYTRTDVFIEKAEKYLEEHFINEVSIIAGGPVVIQFNQAFENFIKYMKGE